VACRRAGGDDGKKSGGARISGIRAARPRRVGLVACSLTAGWWSQGDAQRGAGILYASIVPLGQLSSLTKVLPHKLGHRHGRRLVLQQHQLQGLTNCGGAATGGTPTWIHTGHAWQQRWCRQWRLSKWHSTTNYNRWEAGGLTSIGDSTSPSSPTMRP